MKKWKECDTLTESFKRWKEEIINKYPEFWDAYMKSKYGEISRSSGITSDERNPLDKYHHTYPKD